MVDAEEADQKHVQLMRRPEYDGLSAPLGHEADYFGLLRLAALELLEGEASEVAAAPAAEAHLYPNPEPAYTRLATDDLFAILPADTDFLSDAVFPADVVPPADDGATSAEAVPPVEDDAAGDVVEPTADVSSPEADSGGTADGDGAGVDTYPFEEGLPPELEAMKGFIRKAFAAMADDVEPGDTPGFVLDGSSPCLSIDPTEFLGG